MATAFQVMLAKRAKALGETAPTTPENPVVPLNIGLKTVLTGKEIALPSENLAEVEWRFRSIQVELKRSRNWLRFFREVN